MCAGLCSCAVSGRIARKSLVGPKAADAKRQEGMHAATFRPCLGIRRQLRQPTPDLLNSYFHIIRLLIFTLHNLIKLNILADFGKHWNTKNSMMGESEKSPLYRPLAEHATPSTEDPVDWVSISVAGVSFM